MNRSSKEQHLFEIFCNIVNVFIVIFDQFKTSLLNKSIYFILKNLTDPKLFNGKYKSRQAWGIT